MQDRNMFGVIVISPSKDHAEHFPHIMRSPMMEYKGLFYTVVTPDDCFPGNFHYRLRYHSFLSNVRKNHLEGPTIGKCEYKIILFCRLPQLVQVNSPMGGPDSVFKFLI